MSAATGGRRIIGARATCTFPKRRRTYSWTGRGNAAHGGGAPPVARAALQRANAGSLCALDSPIHSLPPPAASERDGRGRSGGVPLLARGRRGTFRLDAE